jgi:hypothetical protein
MPIQVIGLTGAAVEVGSSTTRAVRVQSCPVDYGTLGVYRFSWLSGSFAPGAITNEPVWSFRWTDATRLCVLQDLIMDGIGVSTPGFAGSFNQLKIFIARSFTVSDTGGATFTLSGNNGKLRTNTMQPTLLGELRATTNNILTAGTRTLDAQPIASQSFPGTASTTVVRPGRRLLTNVGIRSQDPVVLAQNEGLIGTMTLTASGTCQVGMTSCHAEVAAY